MKTALEYSPICPLLLFKEGDDINQDLCDYESETRSCSMGCKRGGKSPMYLDKSGRWQVKNE